MKLDTTRQLATIPPDCPVPAVVEPLTAAVFVNDETLLTTAVDFGDYGQVVNKLARGERLTIYEEGRIAGHTACSSCVFKEECRDVLGLVATEVDSEIQHPQDILNNIDPKTRADMLAVSVSVHAQESGYTRESVANLLGGIAKMDPAMRTIIFNLLENDPRNFPTQIGRISLADKPFQFIDIGDKRLVISENALSELQANGGTYRGVVSGYFAGLLEGEKLKSSLKTGDLSGLKITGLKSYPKVKEFNRSAQMQIRGFGTVIGSNNSVNGESPDTVVITHVADAKGGVDSTNRVAGLSNSIVKRLSAAVVQDAIKNGQTTELKAK